MDCTSCVLSVASWKVGRIVAACYQVGYVLRYQQRSCIPHGFETTPGSIQQVAYVQDVDPKLEGAVFSFSDKQVLQEFGSQPGFSGKLCAIAFRILAFVFPQVFVLINILEEQVTLFLCG